MLRYIIMVTDGVNSDETKAEEGLALTDFSIYPHCAFSGDTFSDSFYIGTDFVKSNKLLLACQGIGNLLRKELLKGSLGREDEKSISGVMVY